MINKQFNTGTCARMLVPGEIKPTTFDYEVRVAFKGNILSNVREHMYKMAYPWTANAD